jgi:hypothetical protein
MKIAKSLPWIAGALALAGAGVAAYSPSHVRGFDLDGFARIPVLEGGRLKPVDSVARNGASRASATRGARSRPTSGSST